MSYILLLSLSTDHTKQRKNSFKSEKTNFFLSVQSYHSAVSQRVLHLNTYRITSIKRRPRISTALFYRTFKWMPPSNKCRTYLRQMRRLFAVIIDKCNVNLFKVGKKVTFSNTSIIPSFKEANQVRLSWWKKYVYSDKLMYILMNQKIKYFIHYVTIKRISARNAQSHPHWRFQIPSRKTEIF